MVTLAWQSVKLKKITSPPKQGNTFYLRIVAIILAFSYSAWYKVVAKICESNELTILIRQYFLALNGRAVRLITIIHNECNNATENYLRKCYIAIIIYVINK